MSNEYEPRATDIQGNVPKIFRPGADPDEWIEQLASPYRERPWAVVRELVQNASDAVQKIPKDSARFVEFALVCKETKPTPGVYHFVVRDSGEGMDDITFCREVGILGVSSKKEDCATIGQFGVGFYSTHAICIEVVIISKLLGNDMITGWKYVPGLKRFFQLEESEKNSFLTCDFERHPVESKKRKCGTSVYLNIDFQNHGQCEDWLVAENIVRNAQRDFFILPANMFVSDYTEGFSSRQILDSSRLDASGRMLNVCPAPWEIKAEQNKKAVLDVLQSQLPYTKHENLPKEWYVFHKQLGNGSVSGLFYLVDGAKDGHCSLFVKRMYVETAKDLKPLTCEPVYSVINFTPDDKYFKIGITAHRDHVTRDAEFIKGREIVEDASLDFLQHCGEKIVEALAQNSQVAQDIEEKIKICSGILSNSQFFSALYDGSFPFLAIITDTPQKLRDVLRRNDCTPALIDLIKKFVEKKLIRDHTIDTNNLPPALEAMQEFANQNSHHQRISTDRDQIVWNPRLSEAFINRIGPYLPITIAMRRRRRDGTFEISTAAIPLKAVPILDPGAIKGVDVLVKGNAAEYLAKNRERNSVIIPSIDWAPEGLNESRLLFLSAFAATSDKFHPKLRFVELRRDLFQEIQTEEAWEPLVACFDSIVGGTHGRSGKLPKLRVRAMGYQGDSENAIPLLSTSQDDVPVLVINAYNPLMKELLSAYTNAASRNDPETTTLLGDICHELYHHTVPATADNHEVDWHGLETRKSVFNRVLNIVQRYMNMKE